MDRMGSTHFVETVVIGGGQAGLSVGHQLARRGMPYVILDANEHVGDSWRKRWDSLRLFTPARYDSLPGLRFPAPADAFPTKDAMADYLSEYAKHFRLNVQTGICIDRLSRGGDRFLLEAGEHRLEADNVVVAMSDWQQPRVPAFAGELRSDIVQLHSKDYRNPSQFQEGDVLVVGAGNSGAEVALDAATDHTTLLSGRDAGSVPFDIERPLGKHVMVRLVVGVLFHHVLTIRTPAGRRLRQKAHAHGMPLVRTRPRQIAAAGIARVPQVVGVKAGLPLLADGRVVETANVVWCTGFEPGLSWIDLPIWDKQGLPRHERGAATDCPGLYFVGRTFIYAVSSSMVHGVGRDAVHTVRDIAKRRRSAARPDSTHLVESGLPSTRS